MKHFLSMLLPAVMLMLSWSCGQNQTPDTLVSALATPASNVQEPTRRELADSVASPPVIALAPAEVIALLTENHIDRLFLNHNPDDGFYGNDRYRIEFIITEMQPLVGNPLIYQVKGKNRYKKNISSFEGLMEVKSVAEYEDDHSGPAEYRDEVLNFGKGYTMQGVFDFKEDSTRQNSGRLTGRIYAEFCTARDKNDPDVGGDPQIWICSRTSPSQGSGYQFAGNWTSFKHPSVKKPVIWAQNIFHLANDILVDFSFGDRDVTINPKYRSLGWDTYWEREEWWTESPKAAK